MAVASSTDCAVKGVLDSRVIVGCKVAGTVSGVSRPPPQRACGSGGRRSDLIVFRRARPDCAARAHAALPERLIDRRHRSGTMTGSGGALMRLRFHGFRGLPIAVVLVMAGCGGAITEPSPSPSPSPATTDPMPPPSASGSVAPAAAPVSFRDDIVPIFDASCAFGGCHSHSYIPLWLGPSTEQAPEVTYQALFAASSTPAFGRLVVAGSPEQSFLYRKLTGDFTGLPCDGTSASGCGEKMPRLRTPPAPQPTDAQIAAVAAWITQGAADN
jgi:hypothetical protein